MPCFKLRISYDGSRYRGWQRLGDRGDTVQGKLEALLSRSLGEAIEVSGSGRTDAGVHAHCQTCSFRCSADVDAVEIERLLRRYLPEDIGLLSVEEAPPRFHARLSCTGKRYRYHIWNSYEPNVFLRKYSCTVEAELDTRAMEEAAAQLIGKHDFSAFCSAKKHKHSPVRQLRSIKIWREGPMLITELYGDGFLYNMVRIIMGTLIEVGLGQRSPESVSEALHSRDRQQAGPTAPGMGLFLWDQEYDS